MPERIEVAGPDGPVLVEVTDAAISEHGRAGAIELAAAKVAPAPKTIKDAPRAGE
jgi:hypothetical protein